MGVFSGIQAMKSVSKLKSGGTAKLSLAQVSNLIINLPDAQKKLSPAQFNSVYALFREFQKCKTKHEVDLSGYYAMAVDIIKKFDKIAPYEKYSGGNELEFSFLMDEIRNS